MLKTPLVADEIYAQLCADGYLQVPFALSRQQCQQAIDAFMIFLSLPETVKGHISFKIAPRHRRGDVGYCHRKSEDHIYNDSKEYFHFHPAVMERYESFIQSQPLVEAFFNQALPIWELASQTVSSILRGLDNRFPGLHDKVFATKDVHILLRFLKYEWNHAGKYLAKPHYDAGSFTLAIAESSQGLRIGKEPDSLNLVEHQANQALFFLSSNYQKLIDDSNLKAGWHDVIQLDETQIGLPYARWAIVAFVEGHNLEALSREQTHKWYQPR